ncbi:hypothetical protein [Acidiplasma cupricumulans]|jgi:hypothetical protein|uniref:Uncharacterized protein n=1 Tax=Acidiplasma cupricumulans TaxID=312540 RepID=A0A0Q0RLA2_9ARCH|nr:hypothetical protein [Acidiplasma cupricumulans]KQB36334.1 hypothetical protein AOG55_04375 [Acidiplasma cupricumulans]
MIVLSTVGKLHNEIKNYTYKDLADMPGSLGYHEVFIAYTSEKEYNKNPDDFPEISMLKRSYNIYFNGIDMDFYRNIENEYKIRPENAETTTKKNLLDMLNSITRTYLEGYWKDGDTINSELTDSVFRAKHKFMLSMNPDYEQKYWVPMHEEIFKNIIKINRDLAIISEVESSFYFKDKLKKL